MVKTKKRKPKVKRNYFTHEAEDAILLYNKTNNPDDRSRLYSKHIHYPFFKLTQNIIHTFKFYHTEVENLEHLQHEIEVFLLGKLPLYHHSKSIDDRLYKIIVRKYAYGSYEEYIKEYELNCKESEESEEDLGPLATEDEFRLLLEKNASFAEQYGLYKKGTFLKYTKNADKITQEQINTFIAPFKNILNEECFDKLKKLTPPKAYSYFGTITKRWLINYCNGNYGKKIKKDTIEDLSKDINHSYGLDEVITYNDRLSNFMDNYVEYITFNIYKLFPKSNDAQVADAVLELFRKRSDIDIFQKKALYLHIRELGEFKTPKITKVSNILYDIYKDKYTFYLENGYTNFEMEEY
tara:strand:- start:372 stop:1427 length:1056 start_codon:yes stop_codon:yes gene_type:complete